jgi:hypothetical protein
MARVNRCSSGMGIVDGEHVKRDALHEVNECCESFANTAWAFATPKWPPKKR